MGNNKYINIEKETIENILLDLNNVLLTCDSLSSREKIEKIILTLSKTIDRDNVSIDDLILDKMRQTKVKDPDLHLKLYMLHRKLQDGKISEEEARAVYKNYYTI